MLLRNRKSVKEEDREIKICIDRERDIGRETECYIGRHEPEIESMTEEGKKIYELYIYMYIYGQRERD